MKLLKNTLVASIFATPLLFSTPASSEIVTVQEPTGVIIGYRATFTSASNQRVRNQIIRNINPDTCVEEAAALQTAYQQAEMADAAEYGYDVWTSRSHAFCSAFNVEVNV